MSILKKKYYNALSNYVRRGFFLASILLFFSSQKPQFPNREYQLKAAFLYNFTQFVEFPSNTFSSSSAPITIGIVGDDPFGSYLDDLLKGEKIQEHPLLVQRFGNPEDIKSCHILFINLIDPAKQRQVLEGLKGKSILTVGESNNFIQQGGIIRFYSENNKIQLQINPNAAKSSGVIISSKLLRLAEIKIPK